jgi:hypothetical protein
MENMEGQSLEDYYAHRGIVDNNARPLPGEVVEFTDHGVHAMGKHVVIKYDGQGMRRALPSTNGVVYLHPNQLYRVTSDEDGATIILPANHRIGRRGGILLSRVSIDALKVGMKGDLFYSSDIVVGGLRAPENWVFVVRE